MFQRGSEFSATIEKAVAGGRMLARHEGRVVLIAGVIPGEHVRAQITEVARGVTYAAPLEILDPHPARREPLDADLWRRGPCGGNVYQHIACEHQLALKQAVIVDAFSRIARLDAAALGPAPPVVSSPEHGYRMRARLHLRRAKLGFFREGSHALCDPAATRQLSDAATSVLARVQDVLRPREAVALEGEVELTENVPASERVLHFALNRKLSLRELKAMTRVDGLTGFTTSVAGVHGAGVVIADPHVHDELVVDFSRGSAPDIRAGVANSVRTVGRPDPGSVARGEPANPRRLGELQPNRSSGLAPLRSLAGAPPVRLRRHVRSFFQGNRFLLNRLLSEVLARVPVGPVIDLYAGVGLFGVPLAVAGRRPLVAVEADAFCAHDLRTNAVGLDLFEVVERSVEDYLATRLKPGATETVVLDPPRTGLSKEALAGIIALRPPRIVYLSCDVATLARDTRALLAHGYRLRDLLGFDLFPNTAHIETLATLTID